jgi:hypothetical protein
MVRKGPSRSLVLAALGDHGPKSLREVVAATGLGQSAACNALIRCWKRGLILRTKNAIYEYERIFKGRGGMSGTTRPYHLYVLKPEGMDSLHIDGNQFVRYAREHLDVRGGGSKSKAQLILEFVEEHKDKAWFSKEIAESLKNEGVLIRDVMANIRRFERRGLVYVRGYKTDERQTPFKKGYLITWLDPEKPREEAIEDAVRRTDKALTDKISSSPLMERIHRIRDMVIEHSKLRKIVGFTYIRNKLGCTEYEAEHAMSRALQLYPDLKGKKIFNAYRYYYHASFAEEDLHAAVEMKRNYIRIAKGRAHRVGHNWEAVAEWFIDRFTTGAKFWTQNHRNQAMDPRRITLHLIRSVGGRRSNAEVDRIWEVTPGVFAPPVTYVLSCKWGLVRKRDVDDFLDVLRWSKQFGADTPDGRQVKQGVVGVFAGSAFNPKENVRLKDDTTISLASYTARMNIQLLKAADFNGKLRERGAAKNVTVQKICKIAKDESEVRNMLTSMWESPSKSEDVLIQVIEKNRKVYDFERMLEESKN